MNLSKLELKRILLITTCWTVLNFIANTIGLWIPKIFIKSAYVPLQSLFVEFIQPVFVQSIFFGVCFAIGRIYLKNKNLSKYIFAAFQFVVFHVIFLLNLKFQDGIHFSTTFKSFGLRYLSYFGQYLTDILYVRFPIDGYYLNGAFAPSNLGTFYIHWIFMNILYYLAISWLAVFVANKIILKESSLSQS